MSATPSEGAVKWRHVQGLVLHAYQTMCAASWVGLRVTDAEAARRQLGALLPLLTFIEPAGDRRRAGDRRLNIAFTAPGLAALGLSESALATFPMAFREGMAEERRCRLMGDTGESAPAHWLWGGDPDRQGLHVLLLVYSADETGHEKHLDALLARLDGALEPVSRRDAAAWPGDSDQVSGPFGFRDGISQPVIDGTQRAFTLAGSSAVAGSGGGAVVAPGEFVLGYRNAYGQVPLTPRMAAAGLSASLADDTALAAGTQADTRDLGINGTFLVIRELAADVRLFWQQLDRRAGGDPALRDWLAAKCMGRWRNGSPLTLAPDAPDDALRDANDFLYRAEDWAGTRCPMGAHIRRANPRDSLIGGGETALFQSGTRRILRRGRRIGPVLPPELAVDPTTPSVETGLMFIGLNASIERQFEFVQQHWLNSTIFNGVLDENDPLVGDRPVGAGAYTIPGAVPQRLTGLPRFVTMRGGGYFFMPGREGFSALTGIS